jgi:hypothetical protein
MIGPCTIGSRTIGRRPAETACVTMEGMASIAKETQHEC